MEDPGRNLVEQVGGGGALLPEEVDGGGVLGWDQHRKFSLAPSVLLRQEYFLQRPLCPLGASWLAGNPGCFLPISGPYW